MGIFPVWGFQLIIAIFLAFLLRLNKILVVIGANISVPPMIPLILFLSHSTGAIWMGNRAVSISWDKKLSLDLLKESFLQYLLGAITLSLVSGVIFGLITYCFLKVFNRKASS